MTALKSTFGITQAPQDRPVSRRDALKGLVATGAIAAFTEGWVLPAEASTADHAATLQVGAVAGATIPADYTGLSYETSQLIHQQFFSGDAQTLARYFRLLGKDGVLRIGGNLSEFSFWAPQAKGGSPDGAEGPDPGHGSDKTFNISSVAIDHLVQFLGLAQWKLIYGLNLAAGTPEAAADEAAYVAEKAGDRLVALQFGNEPDLFKHKDNPKEHWTYEEFSAKWQLFYDAVRKRLPNVPIAGPDTSYQPVWMKKFAEQEKGKISLLTGHYYAGGPPTDPKMTTGFLLEPNSRLQDHVLRAIEIAKANGIPYRMSEGNTCYGAGKKGVSDTFASALWAVDFWLQIAMQGSTGINLHGGGNGYYTPIAGSPSQGFVARPIFYGMMLAGQFAGADVLPVTLNSGTQNLVAYAGRKADETILTVVNRSAEPAGIEVALGGEANQAFIWRLEAPSLESTTEVTLAGSAVTADGLWSPTRTETLRLKGGSCLLRLAPYSAVLLRARA